mgnify:CR=1 FL=1
MDIENALTLLTLEEKAALTAGTGFMFTNPIPRLDIPSIALSDGPHGVRKQIEGGDNGVTQSEPATCFPPAVTVASSWNPENARKMAGAIADECKFFGISVILGPGTNIKRNPRCGRNFEYYSEDPFLAGSMASSFIQGAQGSGVAVSMKHFAVNSQENYRFMGNSIVDERTTRELYLKPFEKAVKEAKPKTLMCAYNQINGIFASENEWLLTDVLRKDWGFEGLVMSDWGAVKNRVSGVKAGLDLEMPGDCAMCRASIIKAVKEGALSMEELDAAVRRVLTLVDEGAKLEKKEAIDIDGHFAIALDIALDGAVLLQKGLFPLMAEENLIVIGDLFENMRFQGAGSSMINPIKLSTPKDAFDAHGVAYSYAKGYDANHSEVDADLIEEAVSLAKGKDKVLLFIGLTDLAESEGGDREHLALPENQLALISKLIEEKKTIDVVLFGGSVIELPFANDIQGLLYMALPGEAGGEAAYRLIFGEHNPSGRLSETWVKEYADVPYGKEYSTKVNELYKENLFVGYRYYSSFDKPVRFPFGYGLSYAEFEYSDWTVEREEGALRVSVSVKNVSGTPGAEVVQVYVAPPRLNLFRPKRELKGFRKVYLDSGETKTVCISIKLEDLRYWSPNTKAWVLEDGEYQILLGKDVDHILEATSLALEGVKEKVYEDEILRAYENPAEISDAVFEKVIGYPIPEEPKTMPLTMETPFIHYKKTFFGRIFYGACCGVANKQKKAALKMPPGKERDNKLKGAFFLQRIFDTNSLRSLAMSSGGALPYHIAEMMNKMANGHFFGGLACLRNKYKCPPLPKNQKEKK